MALHKDIPFGCNHIAHSLEYDNAAARTGATGLTDDDIGRVAMQLDNETFWVLTNESPLTWKEITNSAEYIDHGTLSGLDDDDHTIYSLADGSRPFTGTVSGIDPVEDEHLVTKSYVDSNFAVSGHDHLVDEEKVIYVGKHGNDTNDGESIEQAVLTFGKAVQLVEAQTPDSGNVWGIVCLDGGIYAESITLSSSYIYIFAANATLQGSISVPTETSVEFEHVVCSSGTAYTVASGSGTAYFQAKKLETDGCNGLVNSSSGVLNSEIEYYKQTGGIGVTASDITHVDIQDWDLYGASPTAVKNTGGMINVRSANIADRGGSGTSIGFDCNSSTTNALVVYADLDTLFDVESGATLNLITANASGDQYDDGTVNLTTASSPASHTHVEDDITDLGPPQLVEHIPVGGHTVGDWNFDCDSTSWIAVRQFIWRGTSVMGTPTNIKAVARVSGSGAGTADIKIIDISNGDNVIVDQYNYTNTSEEIIDLGTISNLPSNEAIFEIQLKVDDALDINHLSSVEIYY